MTPSNNSFVRKPNLSYLPTFNVSGGRPDERFGTQGSFTRGVRVVSGGEAHDVPIDNLTADNPGTVLFVSSIHKPDLSGEARTNVSGGRPTERVGSRGGFTPGAQRFSGGQPRDVPLRTETIDRGTVLFVSSMHKPDMSAVGRTNAVRPTERLGSSGRFTPGAQRFRGGQPRDVPLARVRDPGTVIFQSSTLPQPDLTAIVAEETNVAGGRAGERRGRHGSFNHGVVAGLGGPLQMQGASTLEEYWLDISQAEHRYRRCSPSHFVAGVSILSGGMPVY